MVSQPLDPILSHYLCMCLQHRTHNTNSNIFVSWDPELQEGRDSFYSFFSSKYQISALKIISRRTRVTSCWSAMSHCPYGG